ncbi:hypothetical protein FHW36_1042 [Chitinophaga polysaccharea]|uniref:Uncharacterized protein n=2 Tax=Chitinophaga polysaccharea TaxID=1293035 RepID=A0A561PQD3_9BACT|nr:hypothetical protein FHW36_1042 [Chitinophaga polysaccharea]
MKYKIQIWMIFFAMPVVAIAQKIELRRTDSVFVSWNKATIKSIENQIKTASDKQAEILYLNEDSAFKSYLDIDNVAMINRKSLRYTFLHTFNFYYGNCSGDIYIVEANESGEKIRICNYVLFLDTITNTIDIGRFGLVNGKWIRDADTKVKFDDLYSEWSKLDKEKWMDTVGHGVNEDIVIVTKIKNADIMYSDFYSEGILRKDSPINNILLRRVRDRKLF